METKIDKFNKKLDEMFAGLNVKYDKLKPALENKASVDLFRKSKRRVKH